MTNQQAIELARQHHQAGRSPDAEAVCRQVLEREPDQPDALHMLGILAWESGQRESALELLRRAAAKESSPAQYHYNLGVVLGEMGQLAAAIASYRKALTRQRVYPEASYNLGNALVATGQFDDAIEAFRAVVTARPGLAGAWDNLGVAYQKSGKADAAIDAFQRALALRPDSAETLSNLCDALRDARRFDEAIAAGRAALALRPDYEVAHNNLASALQFKGEMDEVLNEYRAAVALKPDYALARMHLGMQLLLRGDFEQGWSEIEWRLRIPNLLQNEKQLLSPAWHGRELSGQKILLHTEQGMGDSIQFIRYAPLVAKRGGRVFVQCQPELVKLFNDIEGIEGIISGDANDQFDLQCPLMSLPFTFQTTLQNIPASTPYIHADAEIRRQWRNRLGDDRRLKVGLVWAGNPKQKNDYFRSNRLMDYAPLSEIPGIRLISLQYGAAAEQIRSAPFKVEEWTAELTDFSQTAGLIDNLDLLISVDTAPAHLAGAMGRPVWTVLTFLADWRWLLNRNDSPWYPTMRLFRQPAIGDWRTPIASVAAELGRMARYTDDKEQSR